MIMDVQQEGRVNKHSLAKMCITMSFNFFVEWITSIPDSRRQDPDPAFDSEAAPNARPDEPRDWPLGSDVGSVREVI